MRLSAAGGWDWQAAVRPSVHLAGRSLGDLQRRLGVLSPGLGRLGVSPLGPDPHGPVLLGVLHHLGHRALRHPPDS